VPIKVAHIAASDVTLTTLLLNQLSRFREAGFEVAGIAARGPHAAQLDSVGVQFFEIPVSRSLSPLSDLKALIALVQLLRRERFDIIHTHTPKGGLLGQYAALLAGTPIRVHTIHGLYFPGFMRPEQRWLYVWLERITLAFSQLNFSQNPEDIPVAIEERISRPERLSQIGNGIPLDRFDPSRFSSEERRAIRSELGLSKDHVVIGMVGRLVAEKGYREAFEAARLVRERVPNVRFLFVGRFEPKADAIQKEELDKHGIADIAQFLGHRDDVPRLYAAMDLFILPSHREGFPRSVMEAAAMALPSVVTDIRGCRQTVEDGTTGLMVPLRDPQRLADAIAELATDPGKRTRMGNAAREKALREFDENRIIDSIIAAYRQLTASPKRGLLGRARRWLGST
jgi:glycosyltransferase involved in cell wall biosynthesis